MPSIQYRLTSFLFKHTVRPMMAKAAVNPEKFLAEQLKSQQKKKLPLDSLHKKYDFDEKSAAGIPYYIIHSRNRNRKKVVFYFFGGGFVMPGDGGDFEFGQDMADQTGADVWLVWYPLFPNTTEEKLLNSIVGVYKDALKEYDHGSITFFGLSSGGSLCMDVCTYIREHNPDIPLPGKLIPFSATIQMPPSDKQKKIMQEISDRDPMFTDEYVDAAEKMMDIVGGCRYLGNSIAYNWNGFPKIMAFYGSNEIYYSQLDAFKEKCRADGVKMKAHVGKGMMHTWAAAGWMPEAKKTRKLIYQFIRG